MMIAGGRWWMCGVAIAVTAGLLGCSTDMPVDSTPPVETPDPGGTYGPGADTIPPTGLLAQRASRSSTIALSDDNKLVAMVNPDDDSISVFKTTDHLKVATVKTGDEPWSIVFYPDNKTAFVANRAAGTVVKVSGLDTLDPKVEGAPVDVGSEPTGLALSPSGAKLFVAELAQGRIEVLRTDTMQIIGHIDAPKNPRSILVTNNGDANDDDELLLVPEFFGDPVSDREGKDDGRTGRIRVYEVGSLMAHAPILLQPIDSGFRKNAADVSSTTVLTSPNQLYSISTDGKRVYVTSVSASPEGPPRFDQNVFAVVYVADLGTGAEVRGAGGTTNLTRSAVDLLQTPSETAPRFVLGDLVDMDFVPGKPVAYAVSRAADTIQRIEWQGAEVKLGSTRAAQIDVNGDQTVGQCLNPVGAVATSDAAQLFVNCWVSRRLGVVNLMDQKLVATVESSAAPTSAAERSAQNGKRFYFTGRGRWSSPGKNGAKGGEGWSACSSCHPDGLSDGITWTFPAGPRQTILQDGSFSHGLGAQKQRVFNYTGIFDEHHDFEANVRGVSGGLGAITKVAQGGTCGVLTSEIPLKLPVNLGQPAKEVNDGTAPSVDNPLNPGDALCKRSDWDDIDNFVRQLRPPHGVKGDPASIAHGRTLFETARCTECHGGAGWTVSRRFFTPSSAANVSLSSTLFQRPGFFPASWSYGTPSLISSQPANIPDDGTGLAQIVEVKPLQVSCALRNVGTFGVPGDAAATAAIELKQDATIAQGRGGYNPPALYGLALGAPYLHHGQARTLEELITDPRWQTHVTAGFPNFAPQGQDVVDLVAFLLSIDASTPEFDMAVDSSGASYDACPGQ
jgi:DNA-binding beta-propeller fold protein YncE